MRQLVEIALRALSPGINDPFTAMTCLDRLGSLINLVGSKQIPSQIIENEHGRPRLLVNRTTYKGLVNTAFDQIRQSARTNVDVLVRMLEILNQLSMLAPKPKQTDALLQQAKQIVEKIDAENFTESDHKTIIDRFNTLNSTILNRRADPNDTPYTHELTTE